MYFQTIVIYYLPRMQVRLCFRCVCVCLFVQTITFEVFHIETLFLVWWYILTISRSSLSTKVIGSRSRSSHGKCLVCYMDIRFNLVRLVWCQGHKWGQDQGHSRSGCECLTFYRQAGGGHLTEWHSCYICYHYDFYLSIEKEKKNWWNSILANF